MPIDASPDDLDALRELVAQLSSERDAALDECRRVMEQNDRLRSSSGDICELKGIARRGQDDLVVSDVI